MSKRNIDVDVNATFQRLRSACQGKLPQISYSGEVPDDRFLESLACVLKCGLTQEKVLLQKDDHLDAHYPSWKKELAFASSRFTISINDFQFKGSPAQVFLDCDEPYIIFNTDFASAMVVHKNQ